MVTGTSEGHKPLPFSCPSCKKPLECLIEQDKTLFVWANGRFRKMLSNSLSLICSICGSEIEGDFRLSVNEFISRT